MKKLTTLAAAALALAMTGAGALAETTLQLGSTLLPQGIGQGQITGKPSFRIATF